MIDAVAHRGPDGSGTTFLSLVADGMKEISSPTPDGWTVALGHRRLSIIDLSDAGRQPMSYRGRLWITFNGEIYNYVELRRELEQIGAEFRSHTDTEVILAAYEQWGTDCFGRFRGMWGLVLIDGRRRIAVVSRDRLGIKPVYLVQDARSDRNRFGDQTVRRDAGRQVAAERCRRSRLLMDRIRTAGEHVLRRRRAVSGRDLAIDRLVERRDVRGE